MRDPSSATSPGMRRLRVALCVMSLAVFAACGDDPEKATGPATLKYVPADADAVVVVPTDLRGEQLKRLGTLIAPSLREGPERSLRDVLASFFEGTETRFASGLDRARQAAELQVSDVDDAHGAAVARTDFSTWDSDPLGLETATASTRGCGSRSPAAATGKGV